MNIAARHWLGFSAMTAGMFLAILDIQIVASSLIDIQLSLGIPAARLSYLQTTYLIAEVIAIALSGYLTRVMSTRWLFVAAMLGFVLASAACAASTSYQALYVFRFIQGLFGGAIIPLVFSAAFLMFPPERQTLATVIGGGFAMLAPSVGPYIGGWLTEHYSWHWLFLVNIIPGVIAAAIASKWVTIDAPDWRHFRKVDLLAVLLLVIFLASLELALKQAAKLTSDNLEPLALAVLCFGSGVALALRCLRRAEPLLDLAVFRDRTFVIGAWFSFVLGIALFGSIYLLPLFLGLVRGLGPLEIGSVMIVTGIAQLLTAPVAAFAEPRLPPRAMTFAGYALLAGGLLWNAAATYHWEFGELFGPQVLRGVGFMVCLLPVTRLALGQLPPAQVPNGSALFNLMRNIGGAVGLAFIDIVLEHRGPQHVTQIAEKLQAGDRATAAFVGLPLERFTGVPLGELEEGARAFAEPLVRRAATVASLNDAWLLLGGIIALSLLAVPLMRKPSAAR